MLKIQRGHDNLGFIEIFAGRFQTPTIQPSLNFKIFATENQVF